MKDLTGQRLGNYDIQERLGAGGMAVVYRAVQQPLGREVALKALMPNLFEDQGFIQRFEHEARTLARLDHPNILPIFDFVVTADVVFLTMPLVRGGTLRDILDAGPLDGATAWRYLREVGEGLQHAHDAGIVHRDLKPSNVLIHADGRALLADFGLARSTAQDTRLTTAGFTLGTPGYMAPEQVLGHDIDHRVDIYAMGVMTFEMMTGSMPFTGTTATEIAISTVNSPVPSAAALNSVLPDELDHVLARALAKDPAQRPASVRELVALLGRVPQRRSTVNHARDITSPQGGEHVTSPQGGEDGTSPLGGEDGAKRQMGSPRADRFPQQIGPPRAESLPTSPTLAILEQMGLRRLHPHAGLCVDWYFESAIHSARDVAGDAWPALAAASGLAELAATDPPAGAGRTYPLTHLAALTTAFETSFGSDATARLREWGRRTAERALAGRKSGANEQRAIKLVPGKRRLTMLLKSYVESLDEVHGEPAHAWRQIDPDRVWVVHYQNPVALGRRRGDRSCYFSIAGYEAMLRWAGLANDWLVEEIECGCVTGTADCVFGLRSVRT